MQSDKLYIVIPCFNEAERFDPLQAEALLQENVHLILVNDGSTDATSEILGRFVERFPGASREIHLPVNLGKAEAVRRGLLDAIEQGGIIVAYLDADFATPATEMNQLVDIIRQEKEVEVLLGSRWMHLGAAIQRRMSRHYAGRIFATFASLVLNLKVYDTQCGAKLFRVSDHFIDAIQAPFHSRWAFDVELIGRLRQGLSVTAFKEVPLQKWVDVQGSKITLIEMIQATLSLVTIWRALRARKH